MRGEPILQIRNLKINFHLGGKVVYALRGMDLELKKGEIHALVGESGSGKSVAARAILGLTPSPPGEIASGEIIYDNKNMLNLGETELRHIRGNRISMIFQEPSRYLNPVLNVGEQISEQLRFHHNLTWKEAARRALELLEEVELGRDSHLLKTYPHELSGGMRQRVMIAMALACNPEILLADEPTTALDVTVQAQVLELIHRLRNRHNLTVLFVSHDLAAVKTLADRISVIYAGAVCESGSAKELLAFPAHPYSRGLLDSVPDTARRGRPLQAIPGAVVDSRAAPEGCLFAPRCQFADENCRRAVPRALDVQGNNSERIVRCFHPLDIKGGT